MTEYATTPTNTENPIMDPRIYWKVSAWALAAVALLGIIWNMLMGNNEGIPGFLVFDWGHNIVHAVLAGAAFLFGYGSFPPRVVKTMAIVFGFVYGGLGVLGFFLMDLGILHLELGENLVHLLLGAWALVAGFGAQYD